ncbi:MAG: tocopherol cyclase family protein [Bacteroidales bacterium]
MMKIIQRHNHPLYSIRKTWNPVLFQGTKKKSRYFEGWYFKLVSEGGKHIWSVIPGVSITGDNNRHAFIQLINGKTAETWYVKYPLGDFRFSQKEFLVETGRSRFSYEGLDLNIDDPASGLKVYGTIGFRNIRPLESTLLNPGIMGWYSFVPFMECYHGLVSMDHDLSGNLIINGEKISMKDGKGYAEKDWGRSMPSAWIWMQSNHFEKEGVSLMLSIAKIPWLRSSFTGFLCVLLLNGKIHRFATYTGAVIEHIELTGDNLSTSITNNEYRLQITASHASRGMLAAPLNGAMDRRIAESVDAHIELKVTHNAGEIIFAGTGVHAGLELVGDMDELPV